MILKMDHMEATADEHFTHLDFSKARMDLVSPSGETGDTFTWSFPQLLVQHEATWDTDLPIWDSS